VLTSTSSPISTFHTLMCYTFTIKRLLIPQQNTMPISSAKGKTTTFWTTVWPGCPRRPLWN